ncbi:MAG: hypothetical protein ACRD0H_30745, partial [Actinomycetes bacterium]
MATGTTSTAPDTHGEAGANGGATTNGTGTRKAGGGRRAGTPTATTAGRPTRRLVIVESGTKAKKIQQYLGKDYV